jgi:hypothetical protein
MRAAMAAALGYVNGIKALPEFDSRDRIQIRSICRSSVSTYVEVAPISVQRRRRGYTLFNQPPEKPALFKPRTRLGTLRVAFQMIPVL